MTFEEFKENIGSVILTESGRCPVTAVVEMLQGKWKLQIIYQLCMKETMRFGQLIKALKPITNAMLRNSLVELEKDGLVLREQFNEIPPHVEYSLSEKGKDLLPVFYEIANYGLKYIP